jgi:hypothetical protein
MAIVALKLEIVAFLATRIVAPRFISARTDVPAARRAHFPNASVLATPDPDR